MTDIGWQWMNVNAVTMLGYHVPAMQGKKKRPTTRRRRKNCYCSLLVEWSTE